MNKGRNTHAHNVFHSIKTLVYFVTGYRPSTLVSWEDANTSLRQFEKLTCETVIRYCTPFLVYTSQLVVGQLVPKTNLTLSPYSKSNSPNTNPYCNPCHNSNPNTNPNH